MTIVDLPLKSPDFFDVASYIYRGAEMNEETGRPKVLFANGIALNELEDLRKMSGTFEGRWENRRYRGANANALYHTILSWNPKDSEQITNDILEDLVYKYLELRNEGDTLAFGSVHRDKDHLHVHIMMSATGSDNRSIRMSKVGFQKMKEQLWEYQREHYPAQTKHSYDHIKKDFDRLNKKKSRGERVYRQKDAPHIEKILTTEYEGYTNFVEYLLNSEADQKQREELLEQMENNLSDKGKVAYKLQHLIDTNEHLASALMKAKQLGLHPYLDENTHELKGVWSKGIKHVYSRILPKGEHRDKFKWSFKRQFQELVQDQQQLEQLLEHQRELEQDAPGREHTRLKQ